MNIPQTSSRHAHLEGAQGNLAVIRPFFIVKDLQTSIAYYRDRLGFELDFQGPPDDVYYAHDDLERRTQNMDEVHERQNGHSHVKAMLLSASSHAIPVVAGEPVRAASRAARARLTERRPSAGSRSRPAAVGRLTHSSGRPSAGRRPRGARWHSGSTTST